MSNVSSMTSTTSTTDSTRKPKSRHLPKMDDQNKSHVNTTNLDVNTKKLDVNTTEPTKKRGKRKKISNCKVEEEDQIINIDSLDASTDMKCPCGTSKPDSTKIDCSKCSTLWHTTCLSMAGELLTQEVIASMLEYKCPFCFIPPGARPTSAEHISTLPVTPQPIDLHPLEAMIRELTKEVEELKNKTPTNPPIPSSHPTNNPHPDVLKALTALGEQNQKLFACLEKISIPNNIKAHIPPDTPRTPSLPPTQLNGACLELRNPTKHIEGIQEDFISPDLAKRLLLILPTLKYTKVGAWETINLGAYYPYTGSPTQDPTAEIPVELQEFMDKANKDICSEFKVNQLTVNRYPCKGGCLTEHEDNEACIKVGSLILAGTLGDGKVLTFRDKMSNKEVDVNPPDKSVYIMSQTSQSLWTHRMERQKQNSSDGADGYQYTITARCVSAQNNNECIILGDSNTDHYKFGEDKGTFGWLLPGKRIPTMRIKHIDPEACIGYPNVNIHVGINDIRECAPPKFKAKTDALPKDIDTHVSNLVRKVNEIKRLSPGSRITVSSMLPTKLPGLNRRCGLFNNLLTELLRVSQPSVKVLTFRQFYNPETRQLHEMYAARRSDDNVHLSRKARPVLAKAIKEGILGSDVDTRSYSNALGSRNVSVRRYPAPTW